MKGRKIELSKTEIKNKEKGITLTALVITIIILLILAGATINLTIGDEGIFTRTIEATDRYKAEEIIEKMQIIKANTIIDDKGKFDIDDFFDNLVEEGIVGDREEIIDNGDGSHTITTDEGYVIDIIEKDEGKDVEIEYVGKGEKVGPRIKEIHVRNKTTGTIEIEVEAINSEGAKYTYSYKKEDEEEYKEAAKEIEENTYKYEKLEANKIYNIKVEVENRGIKKEKIINVRTGELPEGAISIGEVEWENGKAKVEVNINKEIEGNFRLEYKINEEGSWTEIQDGGIIENLENNQTIYIRLTDGTNETEYLSTKIEDNIKPEVSISLGTVTSNSIQVQVTANDKETGLAETNTYEYFLNNNSQGATTSSTHIFSNLSKGTYTLKVVVTDKVGNTNEAEIEGTTEEVTSGLVEGAIKFTNPTWTNGTASIQVSTNTNYKIEYQLNGTEGTWTEISNNGTINNLAHNTNVYARLTDEINSGEYATASIKDTTKPEVSISLGTIKSNSIQVTATASDVQTGLATSNTYEYFLNGTSKGKSTSNSYTYSNLADGTKYTLKVKVLDKAGNSNEASTTGTTSTVPAGTVSGAITFTEPTWSGGKASIKVSTNTSYQIEYQKNSTTGTWTKIASGGTISGLSHNTTVYARLTDGANSGGYASTSIKDTVAPTVSIATSNITTNSVKLTVTASDGQSGLADSGRYTYYLNSTQKASNNTNSYTYTGLTANTSYTLKVVVKDKAGKTTEKSTTIKTKEETVSESITSGKTYTSNTVIKDSYGNSVKIPAGFKIASDSGKNVTEGVVIEDVSAGDSNTKGNQYVWIPIGNVKYNTSGATKAINFGRYEFETNSAGVMKQSADNYTSVVEIDVGENYKYKEVTSSTNGETVAKNLGDFITKAKNAGGYYIGRYEAGKVSGNTNTFNVKKGQTVYNNITQSKAAELARNLYSSNSNVESDLINSYAWDTAIVFIQTFSGDTDYSWQNRLQRSLTTTGNAHDEENNYDERCNIYDMAGNVYEWSTETSTYSGRPCVYRGGNCSNSNYYTAYRTPYSRSSGYTVVAFRSTLYVN